jgi:hypothetical protein
MSAKVTPLLRSTPGRTRPSVRRLRQLLIVVAMVLIGTSAAATPASAHGTDESKEGYVLVQQALGHLAHDGGHVGMDAAMEKVNDALAAKDHDGVDVAEVQQAKQALDAEQVDVARTLLQDSIKAALAELPTATGEQTGTTLVLTPMSGHDGLAGRDWFFLGASTALLLIGFALAGRYRPADTVGDLRRLLVGPTARHQRPRP